MAAGAAIVLSKLQLLVSCKLKKLIEVMKSIKFSNGFDAATDNKEEASDL